jgi:surface antigen
MKIYQFHLAVLIFTAMAIAGCSTAAVSDERAFAAPTHLTATLATPVDIDLQWQNNAASAAGSFVEYSPYANGEFVIITALPPDATKYRHAHLLPDTRFVFRIVPYFGPASGVAEIKTGKRGAQQSPTPAEMADTNSPAVGIKKSIHSMKSFAKAAPADFRATFIPPAGVKLDWVDHAADADGYLVEIKPDWGSRFQVSAFLPAHSTTLATYGFPFDSTFQFRVRPFFYGQPSNVAGQTTGNDSSPGSGAWIKSK